MKKIDAFIQTRRSHYVKEFTGEMVPNEVVERMLANAQMAPSHKLTLPWRLKVFSGIEKDNLCKKMEQYYVEKTAAEKFDQKKLEKIRTYSNKISHIISIGMHLSHQIPEWEEFAATAMAVQNMWLTLSDEEHAAGYWITGNGTGSEMMKEATGLAEGDVQLGFFFLGMVTEKRWEALR